MSETQHAETHAFQAEVREVLKLMVHSLYSNKEIFLRELISNASDACDKLRFEALKDDALLEGDSEFRIEIEVDEDQRRLIVRDNGIGMNREEVAENIGTIARSGTRRFLDQASKDGNLDHKLIGQFGVGFYSAFIVAEEVTVLSRRAGDTPEQGVRWTSDGAGEYQLADEPRKHHGTEVILRLKEDESEFLQAWTLRQLIGRYSDHIGFPIRLKEEGEDDKPEWKTVNQASALWTLPKAEISDDDYQAFYKHLSHDMDDALCWAHNHVEGMQNYTSLLYVPAKAPLDLMLQRDERRGLRLYVRRVFIMDAAEQLLPHYLRFMRGVVDSDDLPLNVSRELLQENDQLRKIRAAVVKRSLDLLSRVAEQEPEQYIAFWDEFGAVLKEGVVEDMGNREKIAGLLRFASTHDGETTQRTRLADYIERMQDDQDTIWYVTAENHRAALNSPHLEVFRKQGIEVLLLSDRIDEWMMGYFTEFDGKPLRSVAKGEVSLPKKDQADEKESEEKNETLERVAAVLGEAVTEVRASQRLTESASCLVLGEQDMALHLRR
ncbi:MAG: molecular chaperone HtpG, partial [Xanthomonadales bacterium]|nr:molecular chaperone HtpG [Xanthomonadales bacterium]